MAPTGTASCSKCQYAVRPVNRAARLGSRTSGSASGRSPKRRRASVALRPHTRAGRGAHLAGFEELLRSGGVRALGNALAAASHGGAAVVENAFQHDRALRVGRVLPAVTPADVADDLLRKPARTAVGATPVPRLPRCRYDPHQGARTIGPSAKYHFRIVPCLCSTASV